MTTLENRELQCRGAGELTVPDTTGVVALLTLMTLISLVSHAYTVLPFIPMLCTGDAVAAEPNNVGAEPATPTALTAAAEIMKQTK